MVQRVAPAQSKPRSILFGVLALVILLVATYANHFQNSFHFDDAHTIVNNAAIRDLRNIPLFFCDAGAFSALPSNQSYRPLVSTLLAVDYWLSGLNPLWFHVSIFGLFLVLTLLLALVIQQLIEQSGGSLFSGWIGLAAAGLYGLHPANADTVNYVIASSEVISTLGVVASFAVYLLFPSRRKDYLFVLPAAITILAKPPAAAFAALFAIYRFLFPRGLSGQWRYASYFADVVPPFLMCGAMLWLVQFMTPHSWVNGAHSSYNYLITQPYVTLLYAKTFFWPSDLSADYDLNPFLTTDDPRFWTGCAFVFTFLVIALAAAYSSKTRLIGFGLLWFVIALLPTSLFSLAEVMNDHRTFFPYVGFVIAIGGLASFALEALPSRRSVRITAVVAILLFLSGNGYATHQRNRVWKDEELLWHDVVLKSPENGRGLMNYGLALMARGDYQGALEYFQRALTITPYYSTLRINLGVVKDATKQAGAEKDFQEALRLAPGSPEGYTYYARYLVSHGRTSEALPLLKKALALSPTDVLAKQLLSQLEQSPIKTPEYYLELSLELYRDGRYPESITTARDALALRPGYAEAWNNIGASYNQLGKYQEAADACEQALRYKPDFPLAKNNLAYSRGKLTSPGH